MITDDDVLTLFEQADPARTTDVDATLDATGYLDALRTRSYEMTIIETPRPDTEPEVRRRTMWIAAAAAVVAIVGGFLLLARDDDAGQQVPADEPPAPTLPPTLAPADDPVSRAEQFLAAFATGDPAAVEALQTPDFEFRYAWPGEGFGEDYHEFEWIGPAYQAASATTYAEPACSVIGEDVSPMTVECETQMALGMHRAVNSPGIPATVTIRMTADGVAAMDSVYGANLGLFPFYAWVDANRAGELPVDDEEHPLTLEGVTELARTEARLASEWADWAVGVAEDTLADFDAGDPETFLERFVLRISGVGGLSEEQISAWMSDGVQLAPYTCVPDGIANAALRIACEVNGTEVPELNGTWRLRVGPDGLIAAATIEPS